MSVTSGCSIVIRAYNEQKHIERLLLGILEQTVREVQAILVDSGSTDETLTIAAQYPVEIVHIHPEEFTFGRSLNRGILMANYSLVVIASAHIFPVYPDWLERLLEPFNDPKVALTYGKQRGNRNTHFSEHQVFQQWFPENSKGRQDHPFCNNANAAIRRSFWENHPYNETLPGLEDLAWARWAFEQGYSIVYVPEAEIIHVHEEKWKGIYNRYRREGMAFKSIYPQEQFTLLDFLRLYYKNVLNDLRVSNKKGQTNSILLDVLRFRFMQLWGTYQGYKKSGPLTRQLKRAFYYPNQENSETETMVRPVEPIQYQNLKKKEHQPKDAAS